MNLRENAKKVLAEKAKEYAVGGNRFANFFTIAVLMNVTPIEALKGCLSKHLASCLDLIDGRLKPTEAMLLEKFGDAFNYCVLAQGMLEHNSDIDSYIGQEESRMNGMWNIKDLKKLFIRECSKMNNSDSFYRLQDIIDSMYNRLYRELELLSDGEF